MASQMSLNPKDIMSIISALNANNYGIFNRKLAHEIGLIESIVLSELINAWEYFESAHVTIKGERGWFFITIEDLQERTSLSREQQDRALNSLINQELIKKAVHGLPAKRYFQLQESNIEKLLRVKKKSTNLRETHKLDCGKPTNCNVGNPQTAHIYKKNLIEEPKRKRSGVPLQKRSSASAADAAISPHGDSLSSSFPTEISSFFWEKRLQLSPSAKKPNFKEWNSELNAVQKEGVSPEEIKDLITWALEHEFWHQVITTPKLLRKHWDTMRQQKNPPANKKSNAIRNRADAYDALEFFKKRRDKRAEFFVVKQDRLENGNTGEYILFEEDSKVFVQWVEQNFSVCKG